MKSVFILALGDATMASIDNTYQMLTRINDFLRYQGKAPYYDVQLVGGTPMTPLNGGLYQIQVTQNIATSPQPDLLVIPQLCGDFAKTSAVNAAFLPWIEAQYQRGTEILSLCSGAYLLAHTGLLQGRTCAVHWAAKKEFQKAFPQVHWTDHSILTDEKGIYTCGGGYAYLNLLLYLIEKHLGRPMALLSSKMFEIDPERRSQYPYRMFQGQREHGDPSVLQAQEAIEKDPTEPISIAALCQQLQVNRRTFERKFLKCTGNTLGTYIQRVKIEWAKKELEAGLKTIKEIGYELGYSDLDTFRSNFKKYTELAPSDYRKKFGPYTDSHVLPQ